jgi:hypothetical protein
MQTRECMGDAQAHRVARQALRRGSARSRHSQDCGSYEEMPDPEIDASIIRAHPAPAVVLSRRGGSSTYLRKPIG